ncbi:MAG: carboxypeptidase regulatory-like domain-containing protein [Acidobacteria bacterium]|nr:carboxypeptidase regulatory-like domain-containing protein [Acidobacteriota bacterium]
MIWAAMSVCALAASLQAGIIHGIVIEQASSRPLARTRVQLQVVRGGRLETVSQAVTSRAGQYWFPSLADGAYVVKAVRAGYAESYYGRKRAEPVAVEGDSNAFAEIRMKKLGAITGRISDENLVALAGVEVIAYPARLPLRMAATAKTDDRGVYRVAGLLPGRYWVRTAAHTLEDGSGLLPTFFPGSPGTQEARILQVTLDGEAADADFLPLPGRLFRISGRVTGCPVNEKLARVTLSSDTGRKETQAPCEGRYTFEGLAPANYELAAEPASVPGRAAFAEQFVDQDTESAHLQMTLLPQVEVRMEGADNAAVPQDQIRVSLRRRDLAGEGSLSPLKKEMTPGYWEVFVQAPASHYFAKFSSLDMRRRGPRVGESKDAPEVFLGLAGFNRMTLTFSNRPAAIEGVVRSGGDPAAGAPVFLYPAGADLRKRLYGYKMLYTDAKGMFRFGGLPPGSYLLMSSEDLDEIHETTLADARAKSVELIEGRVERVELALEELK